MNVQTSFEIATKKLAMAGALAVTALFPNAAAALEVGQCATMHLLDNANQFVIASADRIDNDGKPNGLMIMTTERNKTKGFLVVEDAQCLKVVSEYDNVQINDPSKGGLPLSFLQSSANLRKVLAAAYTNAAIPMVQVHVVKGAYQGDIITLVRHATPVDLARFRNSPDLAKVWECSDRTSSECNLPGSFIVSNKETISSVVVRKPAFGASDQAQDLIVRSGDARVSAPALASNP